MKNGSISLLVIFAFSFGGCNTEKAKPAAGNYVLAIHGGAGTILRSSMTPEKEALYRAGLTQALQAGYNALQSGKSSLDAVQASINVLEDDSLFNAGKGAVFNHEGHNELDASIMDGKTLSAGSVAGVTIVRNPIDASRAVMEKSEHVMLSGRGADEFAREAGLAIVDPSYFFTTQRWDDLQKALRDDSIKMKSRPAGAGHAFLQPSGRYGTVNVDSKFGTVGCVALDHNGNLAAGTSTGGMTNKRYGRIGDSPIIGAGTYANNRTVAVSCTGWGEFYIRNVAAHDLSAMMEYGDSTVQEAGNAVIKKIGDMGGDGGLIALDKQGHVYMTFNTEGMYRGCVTKDGKIEVYIYKD